MEPELSSPQAARILGVGELTIRNYIDRGLLIARRMGVRRIVRIRIGELRRFADANGFAFDEDKLREILDGE